MPSVKDIFGDFFWLIVVLAGSCAVCGVVAWRYIRGRSAIIEWLALAAAGLLTWALVGRPEEYTHVIEYGILGCLASLGIGGSRVLPILFCLVVSLGDEFIQYLTPDRYADVRDLAINFLGACMGQLIALPIDSALDRRPASRSS